MNDLLLRALRRQPVERTPVWFMRQAGRCLPAYRELRREHGFLDIVRNPEVAAQVTRLPLDYFEVDGLVLFMDLSTPFEAAGIEVEIRPGVGPVPMPPWGGLNDVARLEPFEPRDRLDFVLEAIRLLASKGDRPVIGFVGAPFTLCSYLARGSRDHRLAQLRAFILRSPEVWDRLAGFWADHQAEFAIAQHEAGAGAIQLFDSWCGTLDPVTYRERVLPYSRALLERLARRKIPTIHFGATHAAFAEAGGDAIGVGSQTPLDEAWERIGPERAIQGNLDPAYMLAGKEAALAGTREVLRRAAGRPGHIFNLGHGLHPDSDPDVIKAVVNEVRLLTSA